MATPTFILPSAPTYTEGFVNGLNVYPDPTNFVANQVPFTRATTATRTNAAGLIELVPYNLASWSEQFDNAIWTKTNSSIAANTTTAPNGTMTADSLIEDNTNNPHIVNVNTTYAFGTYTASVYAKPNGRNWIFMNVFGASNYGAWFDVQNGLVGTILPNITSATITSVGNGWYRCTITGTNASLSPRVGVYTSTANNVTTYLGNGTSGVFIWGAQLVEGTDALPYQLTETRLNRPRVDFSLGGCPSLLLEPQRTNLMTYSEDINDWTKGQYLATLPIVTLNYGISPNGNLNADRVQMTRPTGPSYVELTKPLYISIGTVITCSVWLKSLIGTTKMSISGAGGGNITINLTDNWVRYTFTMTTVNNPTTFTMAIIGSTDDSLSADFLVWGWQVEEGAYPTTYIPTSSASVTRNQDTFALSNVFTNNMISSAGGTWFVDLRNNRALVRDTAESQNTLFISDSSLLFSTNSICIHNINDLTAFLSVFLRNNGSSQTIYTTDAANLKLAIKWNGATMDVFQNGVKVVSAHPFAATNLNFLNGGGGDVPKNINSMALWNTPLTDDELEVITGEGFDTYALMASNYNYILQ